MSGEDAALVFLQVKDDIWRARERASSCACLERTHCAMVDWDRLPSFAVRFELGLHVKRMYRLGCFEREGHAQVQRPAARLWKPGVSLCGLATYL